MNYGTYAPFYRSGFFNPMQAPMQAPMQSQPMQDAQQFGQPLQQMPTQAQPQGSNGFLFVLNENEASSYPVMPNNTVILWDRDNPTIYIKSVDMHGVPSLRILDFVERTATAPKTPYSPNNFVTIDSFNSLKGDVETLKGKLDELNAKPVSKAKKTEAENDG